MPGKGVFPCYTKALLWALPAICAVQVSVDAGSRRFIGGVSTLDRKKYFNMHGGPQDSAFTADDIALISGQYRANVGRGFVFSARMAECEEDPDRPGYVLKSSLLSRCAKYPPALNGWPAESVDFVHSSKTAQLYSNGCGGSTKGFVPGSPNATADFFSAFYDACMFPTSAGRYLVEVANECNVKTSKCNTTWDNMVDQHIAVADRLARDFPPPAPTPVVCGPTAAFPMYQLNNFSLWGAVMAPFIAKAAKSSVACLSVHYYDTYNNTAAIDADPHAAPESMRTGANVEALMDLQESASAALRGGKPYPMLISEYGTGFKNKPTVYSPSHEWWIIRGVNGKLLSFMERPDRFLKSIPFIVSKATWYSEGNYSYPYPFVLWRRDPPGPYEQTYLHLFYRFWANVEGDRVVTGSSDADVQVRAFDNKTHLFVVVNNLGQDSAVDVSAAWKGLSAAPARVERARLFFDETAGAPSLIEEELPAPPASFTLQKAEIQLYTLQKVPADTESALAMVRETTLYSDTTLASLWSGRSVFRFSVPLESNGTALGGHIRIALGGDAKTIVSLGASGSIGVSLNGKSLDVNTTTQIAGSVTGISKDDSFFGALAVPFTDQLPGNTTAIVTCASDMATCSNLTVASAVLVVKFRAAED